MKTFAAPLGAHYATRSYTLAVCLEIIRGDGQAFRFTTHNKDLVVDGNTYLAGPGLETSDVVHSSGLAPDNLELRILYADDAITRTDLLAGRWDYALFSLFEVDYTSPTTGKNILKTGNTGEAKIGRETGFTIELRSVKQRLQRPVGAITQKTCRYRLGDSNCKVNLAGYTRAAVAVTSSASTKSFGCSSLVEPTAYFQEGLVTATTGPNVGLTRKIKTFTVGGAFVLASPFPSPLEVGNLLTIVAGCQKRFVDDCRNKFVNELNFGGEPHLVGVDSLTAVPVPNV